MGYDTRAVPPKPGPTQLVMGKVERVPEDWRRKFLSLEVALRILEQNESYHFRRVSRLDAEFGQNGSVTVRVIREVDGSFVATVTAEQIERYAAGEGR